VSKNFLIVHFMVVKKLSLLTTALESSTSTAEEHTHDVLVNKLLRHKVSATLAS
jgi:hypothetical protein